MANTSFLSLGGSPFVAAEWDSGNIFRLVCSNSEEYRFPSIHRLSGLPEGHWGRGIGRKAFHFKCCGGQKRRSLRPFEDGPVSELESTSTLADCLCGFDGLFRMQWALTWLLGLILQGLTLRNRETPRKLPPRHHGADPARVVWHADRMAGLPFKGTELLVRFCFGSTGRPLQSRLPRSGYGASRAGESRSRTIHYPCAAI